MLLFVLSVYFGVPVNICVLFLFCSTVQRWLTTAPGAPTTHWYQLRCVLSQPLYVMPGQEITGRLHLVAHKAQSYTIYLTLSGMPLVHSNVPRVLCYLMSSFFMVTTHKSILIAQVGDMLQSSTGKLDLKEPYYRMSQPQTYSSSQDQPNQLLQTQVRYAFQWEF